MYIMNKSRNYIIYFLVVSLVAYITYRVYVMHTVSQYQIINVSLEDSQTPIQKKNLYTFEDFTWKADLLDEKDYIPREKVSLDVRGKLFSVGESVNCDTKALAPTIAGQVSYIRCWFAGAGDEIAVFQENGDYVIKKRWIQEIGGSNVQADPNGPWETIFTLP